jgi:hypothetical protein
MLFNERMALKIRLEQLNNVEVKIFQEIRKEREEITNRLRELDAMERNQQDNWPGEMYSPNESMNTFDSDKRILGRREEVNEMRKVAVSILKSQNEPIRGVDLQRQIEATTSRKIANMTTFMKALMKEEPHVQKLGRGLYIYDYEG